MVEARFSTSIEVVLDSLYAPDIGRPHCPGEPDRAHGGDGIASGGSSNPRDRNAEIGIAVPQSPFRHRSRSWFTNRAMTP